MYTNVIQVGQALKPSNFYHLAPIFTWLALQPCNLFVLVKAPIFETQ